MWFDAYCLSDTLPTEAPGGEPTVKESLSVEPPPPVKEEATSGDFLGYGEPIGSVVEIYPYSTGRERLARSFFDRELFTYFSELSSGQTGWGICYNGWLKIHGWELIGFATFKRVQSVEEEIATSALPPPDGEPTDAQMLDWLQKMGRGVIALVSADGHPDFSADFEGMIYSTNKSIRAAIASPSPRQREETK